MTVRCDTLRAIRFRCLAGAAPLLGVPVAMRLSKGRAKLSKTVKL